MYTDVLLAGICMEKPEPVGTPHSYSCLSLFPDGCPCHDVRMLRAWDLLAVHWSVSHVCVFTGATLFWSLGHLWPPPIGTTLLRGAGPQKHGTQQQSCQRQVTVPLVTPLQPLLLLWDYPAEVPWEAELPPSATYLRGLGLRYTCHWCPGSCWEARLEAGVFMWTKWRGMAGMLACAAPFCPDTLVSSGCCCSQGRGRAGSLVHFLGWTLDQHCGAWTLDQTLWGLDNGPDTAGPG